MREQIARTYDATLRLHNAGLAAKMWNMWDSRG